MRVAVMQPYFYPYMGYFRLIAQVGLFILFDCVQFPRRGRVHRAPLPIAGEWLTLPLAKQSRDVLIRDLALADDRQDRWKKALRALPWVGQAKGAVAQALATPLPQALMPVLQAHLTVACNTLDLATEIRRSSDMAIDPALRGQDRVIEIARSVGARDYWNLPGGVDLYDPLAFQAAGLTLNFIAPYRGPNMSMLHALCTADPDLLRADLREIA